MSTTGPNNQEPSDRDGDEADVQVEKELTVVGYAPEDFGLNPTGNKREFANEICPDTDFFEKKTKTSTKHYVVLENGDRIEVDQSEYDEFSEAIAQGNLEGCKVDKEQDTRRTNRYGTYAAGRKWVSQVATEHLPDTLGDLHLDGRQYKDDAGNCVIQLNASIGRDKPLRHHDERTEDRRYESPDKRRSVTVTFSIGPATPDRVDDLSDELVAAFYGVFGDGCDWCEKVRVAECEVARKGDCFV